jgi:phosphoribosylformylglycinamidine synthase
MKPRSLILRAAGTNCDVETAHAFELAGSEPRFVHVNRLLENPSELDHFQILAIPGGFSYGDDIAAGKILANQFEHHLREPLRRFVEAGKPIIGICNGFQVLARTELLPGSISGMTGQLVTLTNNQCAQFVDRWIRVAVVGRKCIWTEGLSSIELPVAHAEGKFVPADDTVRQALWDQQRVVLVYVTEDCSRSCGRFPDNPNGSVDDIAGICDSTGLVFGLMPHPERYVRAQQHPAWSHRCDPSKPGAGLGVFQNAVRYVLQAVSCGS